MTRAALSSGEIAEASARRDCVVLAHGGGGELMQRLIRERILAALGNDALNPLTDAALLNFSQPEGGAGQLAFTTDSYVVTPLEFPGGDIGRLAVAGTVNDLAVMGAQPIALSLGMILQEGLSFDTLDRILASIATAAREAGVPVVTGDTKVIERRGREADRATPEITHTDAPNFSAPNLASAARDSEGLFLNTAGIGVVRTDVHLGMNQIRAGDRILLNGPIAEHGLTILAQRNGISFQTPLRSDAAPLNHLIHRILDSGARVRFLRDATRGGIAGVLADIAESAHLTVEVDESAVVLRPAARNAAELLGIDPFTVANEGVVVCVVAPEDAERVLGLMRSDSLGRHAACIGSITGSQPPLVESTTRFGGRRIVQRPYGEDLPRIC